MARCPLRFLSLLWGLDCRPLLAAGFLFGDTLGVRAAIPKLLCYFAAKSLRAIKVEPVQTYPGERSDDPLCQCDA
jgi:hypothetical protein